MNSCLKKKALKKASQVPHNLPVASNSILIVPNQKSKKHA